MNIPDLPDGQGRSDSHTSVAVGQSLPADHHRSDFHAGVVVGHPLPTDHVPLDTHRASVGGNFSGQPPTRVVALPKTDPSDGWLELRIWAEMFHDAQLARIAATNRAERGGVDAALYAAYLDSLEASEHVAKLGLRRCYQRVVPTPIRGWVDTSKGVGIHLVARLLGHLGDPVLATPHHWEGAGSKRVLIADEPYERTVSQLWQYCGHGDPTRKPRRGMTADEAFEMGNPHLKTIVHLLAESCMKQQPGNTYRDTYETRRAATTERLHSAPCVRCGPSGKPAVEGSAWSKAHQHADALRIVGKELLRDLWIAAQGAMAHDLRGAA